MEERIKNNWIDENIENFTINNTKTNNETQISFENYEFENHFMINYFPYLTVACQGQAFFFGVVCQFVDYKKLSFLITYMYGICLPVDTLIFLSNSGPDHLQVDSRYLPGRRILLSLQNLAGIGILVPDRVHMYCTRSGTHI